MRFTLIAGALVAGACLPSTASAAGIEIRFCPAGEAHAYPASDERKVSTLVLQNFAVVNTGGVQAKVTSVQIDLLRGDEAVDTRRLTGVDLDRAGKSGAGAQAAGLFDLAAFQFCRHDMIPAGVKLAGPVLADHEALWVGSQAFTWRGDRDGLRVSATVDTGGRTQVVTAALPVASKPAPIAFRFPLRGVWYVGAGPTLHSHHRWGVQEEFAFDLIRVDGKGLTHTGDGANFSDYYAYGQVVSASGAGRVVATNNGAAEDAEAMRRPDETSEAYMGRLMNDQAQRLSEGVNGVVGNYVVIDHGAGVFSVSAHLQPGSVLVQAGDVVAAGQPIGKLGSSGNSTEPHLHWQVCNGPDPLYCAGMPVTFTDAVLPQADLPRALQTGDFVSAP